MTEFSEIRIHPLWNPRTLRIEMPKKKVMKLPVKDITDEELWAIEEKWSFNPESLFDGGLGRGVVGHDLHFRYRIKIRKVL